MTSYANIFHSDPFHDKQEKEQEEKSYHASYTSTYSHKTLKIREDVIILDWDDTIYPSSFLSTKENIKDPNLESQFQLLSDQIVCLWDLCFKNQIKCYIITNSEEGWTELCMNKYLPNLIKYLDRIPIISARTNYETQFPDNPLKWKYYAFSKLLTPLLNKSFTQKHIISFGDGPTEREAAQVITHNQPHTYCKIVKFKERPSFIDIIHQMNQIIGNFFPILYANHSFDKTTM